MGKPDKKRVRESSDMDSSSQSLDSCLTEGRETPKQAEMKQKQLSRTVEEKEQSVSRHAENQTKISDFTSTSRKNEKKEQRNASDKDSSILLASRLDSIQTQIVKGNEKVIQKIDVLTGEIYDLHKEIEELKNRLSVSEVKNKELNEEVATLKQQMLKNEEKLNELEQYGRKDQLRFFGVPGDNPRETAKDCEKKVMEVIQIKLGLKHITAEQISVLHRVGKPTQGKDRSVIAKFISRKIKQEVLFHRKKLKGLNVSIQEDLTRHNAALLQKVSRHPNVKNTWAKNGKLYASLNDDTHVLQIQRESDIEVYLSTRRAPISEHDRMRNNQTQLKLRIWSAKTSVTNEEDRHRYADGPTVMSQKSKETSIPSHGPSSSSFLSTSSGRPDDRMDSADVFSHGPSSVSITAASSGGPDIRMDPMDVSTQGPSSPSLTAACGDRSSPGRSGGGSAAVAKCTMPPTSVGDVSRLSDMCGNQSCENFGEEWQ